MRIGRRHTVQDGSKGRGGHNAAFISYPACHPSSTGPGEARALERASLDPATQNLLSAFLPASMLARKDSRSISDSHGDSPDIMQGLERMQVGGDKSNGAKPGPRGEACCTSATRSRQTAATTARDDRPEHRFEGRIPYQASAPSRYIYGDILGVGTFSVVKKVTDRVTQRTLACKIIPIERNDAPVSREGTDARTDVVSTRSEVEMEIRLLRRFDHPNVMRFYDVFETDGQVHLLTELLPGGELLAAVTDRGSFTEEDAREIFKQLMQALQHIHSMGVVHRDVKLENLMLADPDDITSVKLVDFGLAADINEDPLIAVCGTPQYVAPEVLRGVTGQCYGCECDIWAAGVLLFHLLSGYPPFHSGSVRRVLQQVSVGAVDFQDPVWYLISNDAIDLLEGLLKVDPRQRITPEEVLSHPWVVGR